MNFYIILAIVYLFGEYVESTIPYLKRAQDTPKKVKQIEHAYHQLAKQLFHRSLTLETLERKARKRIEKFKSFTLTPFTELVKPMEGWWAKRLWNKAMNAKDKYLTIKHQFEDEKFCHPPISDSICSRVFQEPYFTEEKLTYRPSSNSDAENEAQCVPSVFIINKFEVPNINMKFKTCSATKKDEDGTEIPVTVYLQSAYKQPLLGGWKFFVIFEYILNPITEEWERLWDVNDVEGNFRYEAYLSLS